MILWALNALRTLLVVLFYMLSIGRPLSDCERVWDMSPDSHLPAGKTYEAWYGSFALDCPIAAHDGRSVIFCFGSNC